MSKELTPEQEEKLMLGVSALGLLLVVLSRPLGAMADCIHDEIERVIKGSKAGEE